MLIFATDHYVLPLPPGHRFLMPKYARLRERVAKVARDRMRMPLPASDDELARAHSHRYIEAVVKGTLDTREMRRIGFPWSLQMVERSRRSAGATIAACRSALEFGAGVNLAGGTHHAHHDHGEGFCVFNDAVVAIRAMQAESRIGRALIVDLDVHQGDGTAEILEGDASVHTLSLHGRNNFPFRKCSSRQDVELDDGTADASYLATLAIALSLALQQSRAELAIYLAGADPYVNDRLGRLALTKSGLVARDAYVLDSLQRAGVPVAIVMAGGYADDIDDVVDIHFATVSAALERYAGPRHTSSTAYSPSLAQST
ncbi:MAG TPA: histone deacetylase [Casimicrobiaceae bacterium]|nr:histone deacetylase [Casimicrobiaceae bacterium]